VHDTSKNEQNIFHAEDISDIKAGCNDALDRFADLFVGRIDAGNDDEDEVVDRLIITYELVRLAIYNKDEFDHRFRRAKMRKLRSDAEIPLFSQAARLGMEFTRQQKKTGKVSSKRKGDKMFKFYRSPDAWLSENYVE